MAVKRQYSSRREVTSKGYDALAKILEPAHILIKRDHSLAYSRHILAFVQYRAILLFQDNDG